MTRSTVGGRNLQTFAFIHENGFMLKRGMSGIILVQGRQDLDKLRFGVAREISRDVSINSLSFTTASKQICNVASATHSAAATMGVPFEALIPYGIMLGMFGVTGVSLSAINYFKNNGKAPRRQLTQWDRQMMERDYRLTGVFRGQSDRVQAPPGYELNSQWKMERKII